MPVLREVGLAISSPSETPIAMMTYRRRQRGQFPTNHGSAGKQGPTPTSGPSLISNSSFTPIYR